MNGGSSVFCTKCGTDLPDDSRFCRSCGQTLGVVSTGGGAAAAVAPARIPLPKPKRGLHIGIKVGALALLAGFLLLVLTTNIGSNVRSESKSQAVGAVLHTPITVKDEVENLPAASWKAVPLNLPYSGSVNVNLSIVQGNPVDVFLARADQLETIKKEQWNNVQVFTDFNASKTKTYRRDGKLGQGGYYLVVRDSSLGILSASASDISLKVQLNP
jgi:hypothetical protein